MNAQRQTNTFIAGMNMDLDYSLIKNNQYNYAENIRVVCNDDNSFGALQNIEGVLSTTPSLNLSNETIVHVLTIRDWAIVFTKKNNLYNIYRYDFGISEISPLVTTIVSGLDLDIPTYDGVYAISSVGKWESRDYVKVYFADGKHQIRIVNVGDKYNSTPITTESINVLPEATLPPLQLDGYGNGALKTGMYQYLYQLFNPRSNETNVSVLSPMIRINKNDDKTNSKAVTGSGTEEVTGRSIKLRATLDNNSFTRIKIIRLYYKDNTSIPDITVLDESSVYQNNISYEDKGGSAINELTVDELNALNSYNFSPKVLESKDNILFAANVTENTWDITDEDYDARAYRCNRESVVRLISNSGNTISRPISEILSDTSHSIVPLDHDCICPYNYMETSEDYDYQYKPTATGDLTFGGKGQNIEYEFITTDLVEDDSNTTTDGLLEENWELNSNKYNYSSINIFTVNRGSRSASGVINFSSSNPKLLNYAEPEIDFKLKGYCRDEIYRFGIVFYNKENTPSSAHWIADIRMPRSTTSGFIPFESNVEVESINSISGKKSLVTHPLGIKFKVKITDKLIEKGVTGFEIVRCERTIQDRTVVAQGIVSEVIESEKQASTMTCTPYLSYAANHGLTSMTDDYRFTWAYGKYKSQEYFNFISPEVCVNREYSEELLSSATTIESTLKLKSKFSPSSTFGDGTTFKKTSWTGDTKVKPYTPAKAIMIVKDVGINIEGFEDVFFTKGDKVQVNNTKWSKDDGWLYDSIGVNDADDDGESSVNCLRIDGSVSYNAVIAKYYNSTRLSDTAATIDAIKYAQNTDVFDLQDNKWRTKGTPIGNKTYYNWCWGINDTGYGNHDDNMRKAGPHGICMIFRSSNMATNIPFITASDNNLEDAVSVKLCNLKRNTSPYGGNSYFNRLNSVYISNGSYTEIGNNTDLEVNCFGGDTYIGVLDYANCMLSFFPDDLKRDNWYNHAYVGAYIPCESSVNLSLRSDDFQVSKSIDSSGYANHLLQNDICVISDLYTQTKPLYAYNSAFSAQPRAKMYVSKNYYSIDNLETDTRVLASEPKTNLEVADSWSKFKVANYLDVDTRYGSINNMKVFNNTLFFWQTDAFGALSVNERSLIQDNDMSSLVLGTGGVLTRYDYITNKNGSKENQLRVATKSDGSIYWYDADRNEICGYNGSLNTVSKLKGVQSYLVDKKPTFTNDPITVYDKKYNEVLFTLDDKSLVYNEHIQAFTSFYTIDPDWWAEFTDKLYIYRSLKPYKYNSGNTMDLFTGKDKISYVQFTVNENYPQTKTFDNVEYGGDFTYKTNFGIVYFDTKRQTSYTLTDKDIDYREDTYKFCIPRNSLELNEAEQLVNKSYKDRMKGKYLVCHYKYDCNGGNTFKVPYISTAYRNSFI